MLAASEDYLLNNLRIEIQQIDELPPIPTVGQELLQALNDNDIEIEDIANIILKDASLSAKLLGLANSAFFGFSRSFNDLTDAIINVLGLDLVRGISLGMVVNNCFNPNECQTFKMDEYWTKSLLTANLTKNMGMKTELKNEVTPGFLYLYGLLHSLGKLILATRFPKEIDGLNKHCNKDKEQTDQEMLAAEIKYLGISHCQAAEYLGNKWHLPEDVIDVMGNYLDSNYQGVSSKQALLTGVCSHIVEQWLNGQEQIESVRPEILKTLSIDMNDIAIIAEKEYAKKKDVLEIASQM